MHFAGSPFRAVRGICVLLIAAALLFPVTVRDATATEPRKHVLFVSPGFADRGFWKSVGDTMQAAADALGFRLTIVSGDRKWPLMVSRGIDALRRENPDYVILVNENQQAPPLMEEAEKRGIPMLLLLNTLTEAQERDMGQPRDRYRYWLGSLVPDNELAGYEMARALEFAGRRLGLGDGTLSVLTLAGDFKTPASIDRLAGLDRALNESPDLREIRRLTVNWLEAEAYKRTSIFAVQTRIDAVWAANDPIAIGAIRALRELGREPGRDFVIAGLNWSNEAVEMVRNRQMTLTHGGHFLAGAWAMILLYDHLHGRDFAEIGVNLRFPMCAITAQNADEYAMSFSDEDWSKIDFLKFSRAANPGLDNYYFNLTTLLTSLRTN